jgi:hypothetical protein
MAGAPYENILKKYAAVSIGSRAPRVNDRREAAISTCDFSRMQKLGCKNLPHKSSCNFDSFATGTLCYLANARYKIHAAEACCANNMR